MAKREDRLPYNAAGEFYVDSGCIDCDTCRSLAPELFSRARDIQQSYVGRQPTTELETKRALMALVSCPTASIGTMNKLDPSPGIEALPTPVTDDVYYCGFTSEETFGASSYFIRRPEGNVLIDSPRATRALLDRLKDMGGVSLMFLTHRDDVADHQVFRRELGCRRILHAADQSPGTADVEFVIEGQKAVRLDRDLLAIPVPGHTAGSMALLYKDEVLFSGDHLWWSPTRNRLHASRCVSWHSWDQQRASLRRLLEFRFRWILPGHGRKFRGETHDETQRELKKLIEAVEA